MTRSAHRESSANAIAAGNSRPPSSFEFVRMSIFGLTHPRTSAPMSNLRRGASMLRASKLADWRVLGLFLGAATVVVACGDTGGGTSQSSGSSGTAVGGSAGFGGMGGSAGSGGTAGEGGGFVVGCPSGIVCGNGDCCGANQECVISVCLASCASEVRCGADLSVCCGAGEVCVADKCALPGATCLDWADCSDGEFCEPTLGQCIPQPPAGGETCEDKPPPGPLDRPS